MTDYQKQFQLRPTDIIPYVTEIFPVFDKNHSLSVSEIGDGNINYVFRVIDEQNGQRLIIKQSDQLLRSSGRPLSTLRSQLEYEALMIEGKLVPGFVPQVYQFDERMHCILMEDIGSFKNLRQALLKEQIYQHLADGLNYFLSHSLFLTSELCLPTSEKRALVADFSNIEMCAISEDLVFTEPYNNYKQQNQITTGNERFVNEQIYQNQRLQAEVAWLRNQYISNAQSLLHGDLHSGSIFVNQNGIKVIDPEFATYGPMGYDIGNVLAHLILSLFHSYFFGESQSFRAWLSETIAAIFDGVFLEMEALYAEKVSVSLYKIPSFATAYLATVKADTLGYTGTEIIRRVIGDARVIEITESPLGEKRLAMERALINVATHLIEARNLLPNGAALQAQINTALWQEGVQVE